MKSTMQDHGDSPAAEGGHARVSPPPDGFGQLRAWSISFRVVDHTRSRTFSLSKQQQAAILDTLAGSAPVITKLSRGFGLTFNVIGGFEECVMRGTEWLWSALEAAGLEGFSIANARLVNHEEFDRRFINDQPPVYYGVTECAAALELSKQRISQLVDTGDFPPPDAYVGSRPAWLEATVRRVARARKPSRTK